MYVFHFPPFYSVQDMVSLNNEVTPLEEFLEDFKAMKDEFDV